MKDIRFVGRTRAGGYAGVVLQRVGEGLCITPTADGTSEEEVLGTLNMENREPLVNVELKRQPARALRLWAERMGSAHLVDLLKEAVKQRPESVRGTATISVDGVGYTIKCLADGMHLQARTPTSPFGVTSSRGPTVNGGCT